MTDSEPLSPLPPRRFPGLGRLRPGHFLGGWLLAKGLFDASVLLIARQGILPLLDLTPLLVAWSALEVVAALLIALGALERARWGWWGAVALSFWLLASGTASVLLDPPMNWPLVVGVSYTYHGLLLGAMDGRLLRGDLLEGVLLKPLPWLLWAWMAVLGCGLGVLGYGFAGGKGALLAVAALGSALLAAASVTQRRRAGR